MSYSSAEIMLAYKTQTCKAWKDGECTKFGKECFDSHNIYPQRRSPVVIYQEFNYIAKKCQHFPRCESGVHCKYAHNALELCFHPSLYKTQMCPFDTNEQGLCVQFNSYCAKAHDVNELRKSSTAVDIIPEDRYITVLGLHQEYMRYYKTKACSGFPYACQCDGFDYHFEDERRRNPFVHVYFAYSCPRIYSQACGWRHPRTVTQCYGNNTSPDVWNCKFAHSFVEWLYHPAIYKTRQCHMFMTKKYCRFGKACPNAHGVHDLRKLN